MGCTWVLGIFYVNERMVWIQYVFAICNSLQVRQMGAYSFPNYYFKNYIATKHECLYDILNDLN